MWSAPVGNVSREAGALIEPFEEALVRVRLQPHLEVRLQVAAVAVLAVARLEPVLRLQQEGVVVSACAAADVQHACDNVAPAPVALAFGSVPAQRDARLVQE